MVINVTNITPDRGTHYVFRNCIKRDIHSNTNFDRRIFKQVLGADEKIILKCILKNTGMDVCIGVIWLRTVFNGKLV